MKVALAKPLTTITEPHSYRFPLLKAKKLMMEEGTRHPLTGYYRKDNGDRMREPQTPGEDSAHHDQGPEAQPWRILTAAQQHLDAQ